MKLRISAGKVRLGDPRELAAIKPGQKIRVEKI